MATFPSIAPTYPLNFQRQPRVLEAVFGDGYVMSQPDGINTNMRMYEVMFERITEADKTTIDNFLVAQTGSVTFDWTPPGSTAGKWICKQWKVGYVEYNQFTVTATFEERPL